MEPDAARATKPATGKRLGAAKPGSRPPGQLLEPFLPYGHGYGHGHAPSQPPDWRQRRLKQQECAHDSQFIYPRTVHLRAIILQRQRITSLITVRCSALAALPTGWCWPR